jgi:hypothetical protein
VSIYYWREILAKRRRERGHRGGLFCLGPGPQQIAAAFSQDSFALSRRLHPFASHDLSANASSNFLVATIVSRPSVLVLSTCHATFLTRFTLSVAPTKMLASRQRPFQLLITCTVIAFLYYTYRSSFSLSYDKIYDEIINDKSGENDQDLKITVPTNSTLGFGAILVVSKDGSERRPALIQAANVTEIDLTIPAQPKWTDEDVKNFKNGPESKMGTGSIMAWLGHHNALQWYECNI